MPRQQRVPFFRQMKQTDFAAFQANAKSLPVLIDGIAPPEIYRAKQLVGSFLRNVVYDPMYGMSR